MSEVAVKRNLDGTIHKVDINKTLKQKKRDEIIDIYVEETGLPKALLEQIYTFCEKTPEKKLKQIKKGQYKNKLFNPKRPVLKDGMVFETCSVRPLTEEEIKPKIMDFKDYEVIEDKEVIEREIEEIN